MFNPVITDKGDKYLTYLTDDAQGLSDWGFNQVRMIEFIKENKIPINNLDDFPDEFMRFYNENDGRGRLTGGMLIGLVKENLIEWEEV